MIMLKKIKTKKDSTPACIATSTALLAEPTGEPTFEWVCKITSDSNSTTATSRVFVRIEIQLLKRAANR